MMLLNRTKKINIKSLITELVLIIIGINLALWVDNLNESYREDKLELKLLAELHQSLQIDLEDVLSNAEVHRQSEIDSKDLLRELNQNEIIKDSIYVNYIGTIGWTFLNSDMSTYESIKAFGIQIIQNDTLRRLVTELYTVHYKYIYEIEKLHMYYKQEFERYFIKYMDVKYERWNFINIPQMKFDNKLKVHIKKLIDYHFSMNQIYEQIIIPNLKKTIAEVEKELDRRT